MSRRPRMLTVTKDDRAWARYVRSTPWMGWKTVSASLWWSAKQRAKERSRERRWRRRGIW